MDPIGASTTWRWYGYENSFVNVDGSMMQSVSGGGHSGGDFYRSAIIASVGSGTTKAQRH
jgi:hypothetical protein